LKTDIKANLDKILKTT